MWLCLHVYAWARCIQSYWVDYAAWTVWMVAFTLLALSVSHLVTPLADGSGIPQMKAYLGGSDVHRFFTWRVMLAKLLGLFFAQTAGLPVGKEVRCTTRSRLSSVLTSSCLS
jgi:H+/Cl- antiporter ClcA